MDQTDCAQEFAGTLRMMRGRQSLRSAAEQLGVTVAELKQFETAEVFPDAARAFDLLNGYVGRPKETRLLMLRMELRCLDVRDRYTAECLDDFIVYRRPDRSELRPAAIRAWLDETEVDDPAERERLTAFLRGRPGLWGYLVDGVYHLDIGNPDDPKPRFGHAEFATHSAPA